MNRKLCLTAWILAAVCVWPARGQDSLPSIDQGELPRLLAEIKPQPGESPWREIEWLTSVTEARRKAITEDKPIVIFTAADGSPLSRT